MITVHFTSVQPDGTSQIQTVQTPHGQSLMDAANAAGIAGIAAICS
jgi:ferredoxin